MVSAISFMLMPSFKKKILFISRERGRQGEREEETSMCGCLWHVPLLGTWPPTQACALTGNRTGDPLVRRLALNPLNYTSQGLGLPHSVFI